MTKEELSCYYLHQQERSCFQAPFGIHVCFSVLNKCDISEQTSTIDGSAYLEFLDTLI